MNGFANIKEVLALLRLRYSIHPQMLEPSPCEPFRITLVETNMQYQTLAPVVLTAFYGTGAFASAALPIGSRDDLHS